MNHASSPSRRSFGSSDGRPAQATAVCRRIGGDARARRRSFARRRRSARARKLARARFVAWLAATSVSASATRTRHLLQAGRHHAKAPRTSRSTRARIAAIVCRQAPARRRCARPRVPPGRRQACQRDACSRERGTTWMI
jgi:hypothetical protein